MGDDRQLHPLTAAISEHCQTWLFHPRSGHLKSSGPVVALDQGFGLPTSSRLHHTLPGRLITNPVSSTGLSSSSWLRQTFFWPHSSPYQKDKGIRASSTPSPAPELRHTQHIHLQPCSHHRSTPTPKGHRRDFGKAASDQFIVSTLVSVAPR